MTRILFPDFVGFWLNKHSPFPTQTPRAVTRELAPEEELREDVPTGPLDGACLVRIVETCKTLKEDLRTALDNAALPTSLVSSAVRIRTGRFSL